MSATGKFLIKSVAARLSSLGAESEPHDESPSPIFISYLFSLSSSRIIALKSIASSSLSSLNDLPVAPGFYGFGLTLNIFFSSGGQ